jgi:hypothetical protein
MRCFKTRKDIDCLKRLFPLKEGDPTKNNYEPTKFENALGKLQVSFAIYLPNVSHCHSTALKFFSPMFAVSQCLGSEADNGFVYSSSVYE